MKRWLIILLLSLLPVVAQGQEDFLAKQYFNDGDFDKAVVFYEKLVANNPRRLDYAEELVKCYHQLEQYDQAVSFLQGRIQTGAAHPMVYIDLGYTYMLMGDSQEADRWYDEAMHLLESNSNFGYVIGFKFERYTLLDRALQAYQRAMELNPELDYNTQMARIYGEQGNIRKMYEAYLDLLAERESIKPNVLRVLDGFVTSDPEAENNLLLRNTLLSRAQKNPNPLWNEMLSWLFVKQRQFTPALSQERAIYRRRDGANLERIITRSAKLVAHEKCNLHGIWMDEVTVS